MPAPLTNNSRPQPRRWTVLGSGILCGLLALVVIYTKPRAFRSPIAVVVVAAIGLVALLLQASLQDPQLSKQLHAPKWLNIAGILCALLSLFSDFLGIRPQAALALAFGAIGAFSISGTLIMHSMRKQRTGPK